MKLKLKLTQFCEFFVERGVLGVSKEIEHLVLEYKGEQLKTNEQQKDMCTNIRLPTLPPTLSGGVCRLAQIYYTLTVNMKSSYIILQFS